jgi:hypothetical protein
MNVNTVRSTVDRIGIGDESRLHGLRLIDLCDMCLMHEARRRGSMKIEKQEFAAQVLDRPTVGVEDFFSRSYGAARRSLEKPWSG